MNETAFGAIRTSLVPQNDTFVVTKDDPMKLQARMSVCTSVVAITPQEFMLAHLSPSGYAARHLEELDDSSAYGRFLSHAKEAGVDAMSHGAMNLYFDHMLEFVNGAGHDVKAYVVSPVFEFDMPSMLSARHAIEYLWIAGIKAEYMPGWHLEVTPRAFRPMMVGGLV